MLRVLGLVCVAAFATCVFAQSIDIRPTVAYEGQDIAFRTFAGTCPEVAIATRTTTVGQVVTVTYELVRQPVGCFAVGTPTVFLGMLGTFAPGSYELRLEGTRDGVARPPIVGSFTVLPQPANPPFARLAFVQGDRQVVTGDRPSVDVVVRATDASGAAVAGAGVVASLAWYFDLPLKLDAFGFAGFGLPHHVLFAPDPVDPAWSSITDANGLARFTVPVTSGGIVMSAGAWPGPGRASAAFANAVALSSIPASGLVVAVEYRHAALDRYVLVVNDDEVAALDRGAFLGWERSIGAVAVWPTRASAPAGAVPVCRFFSPVHTSHFYTVDRVECDALEARWPGVWILESREAFFVLPPPDARAPSCPSGTQPLYRMYRASPGPSHRYVTGTSLRDTMVAAGWLVEGLDGERSAMCVPR